MATANSTLTLIKHDYEIVEGLKEAMFNTNGPIRESYVAVIEETVYRLVRLTDQFKRQLCEELGDINTNAIMNVSMYPMSK